MTQRATRSDIIIEDGILSDMRVADLYDGGQLRAIEEFPAKSASRYEVDRGLRDYFGKTSPGMWTAISAACSGGCRPRAGG